MELPALKPQSPRCRLTVRFQVGVRVHRTSTSVRVEIDDQKCKVWISGWDIRCASVSARLLAHVSVAGRTQHWTGRGLHGNKKAEDDDMVSLPAPNPIMVYHHHHHHHHYHVKHTRIPFLGNRWANS